MDDRPGIECDAATFILRDHPLRAALSKEMHGRKLPPIVAPARLMQVIVSIPDAELDHERGVLAGLVGDGAAPPIGTRYCRAMLGDIHLVWERHTEFSSYLFIRSGPFEQAFDPNDFRTIPADWFAGLRGEVLRATQVAIASEASPATVAASFVEDDLVHCGLMDGLASLWSDFHLNADGFGRLLLIDHGMTPVEAALCTQRVQELGNYRNLALLGLPVAQAHGSHVMELELRLAATTQNIADRTVSDEQLLDSLSDLSAEVARIVADTHYRMSASRAYAEMVEDRLRALRVVRVDGHQTLGDFTERRLLPAVRTCVSFSSRLEALSQRLAWTTALLRTRVDTGLTTQNRDLLRSMDERTALQLRLQQTVEGISVIAISYYLIALLDHIFTGFNLIAAASHELIVACLVPIVVVTVWLAFERNHYVASRTLASGDSSL